MVSRMSDNLKALLILGSPRGHRSASYALGGYLMESLSSHKVKSSEIWLNELAGKPDSDVKLFEAVADADILILACPLYIDSLPAIVTKALSVLFEKHRQDSFLAGKSLCSIINSGFPETHHNNVAVEIAANFGRQCSMIWLGGLAMGMGGAFSGKPLKESGMPTKNIIKSLDLAAEAIAQKKPIPDVAIKQFGKNPIPRWLYIFIGESGWRRLGKKYGSSKILKARPYKAG
jgi:hypothetical protein